MIYYVSKTPFYKSESQFHISKSAFYNSVYHKKEGQLLPFSKNCPLFLNLKTIDSTESHLDFHQKTCRLSTGILVQAGC